MRSLALYENNPFDLIDQVFGNEDFFNPQFRTPTVDVRDESDRYIVEAELPGMSEKDIKLELKNRLLSLSSSKEEKKEEKNENGRWIRRERRDFRFSRSFTLPEDADAEKIEAKFRDGLLTIELPKRPESSPRLVPVKAA